MKKEKMRILSHKFKEASYGSFTYEITFNRSLETTSRMNAMTRGLDKFDKWKAFWFFIYAASPFKSLTNYAYKRF